MKSPFEVLRSKEAEVQKVKKEIEALRTVVRLLEAEKYKPEPKKLAKVVQLP
jgi:hypothetical protein